MDIIESNELIARFMGLETQLNTDTGYTFHLLITKGDYDTLFQIDVGHGDEMLYNSSWDWIIPVCEHIRSLGSVIVDIELGSRVIISFDDGVAFYTKKHCYATKNIEAVYTAVIDFIKFYNNNKLD